MENIVDDLNYRGLIEQYSNEENVRKLLSKKTTIYCGFDPSAASMHVGNYVHRHDRRPIWQIEGKKPPVHGSSQSQHRIDQTAA